MQIAEIAARAKHISPKVAALSELQKAKALKAMIAALEGQKENILAANQKDLEEAVSLASSVKKRLIFDEKKLAGCIEGIESLMELPEPVGQVQMRTELDDGLILERVSCPIGVIGIVFEARPDALVQIASLCLKSGNVALLKGGSEAAHTNEALYQAINQATIDAGMPEGWLSLLHSREDVGAMLALDRDIDLLIPRGSNEFVRYIMDHTKIPVMGHADGVCHTYVDEDADLAMACKVLVDAKTQYPAVCNATECILVHEKIAKGFLPILKEALEEKEVILHTDAVAAAIIGGEAIENSSAEYLCLEVSIVVVSGLEEAIGHINTYGSHHTDAILTKNEKTAETFMNLVDSADVFWNCSTRFADGFRFGFGAEVGVSTSKIHARGPVGLEGLLIYKYKLRGEGHIVADYAEGRSKFTHKKI